MEPGAGIGAGDDDCGNKDDDNRKFEPNLWRFFVGWRSLLDYGFEYIYYERILL